MFLMFLVFSLNYFLYTFLPFLMVLELMEMTVILCILSLGVLMHYSFLFIFVSVVTVISFAVCALTVLVSNFNSEGFYYNKY